MMAPNRYLTVPELAEYIRRSRGAVRNLVLRRAVPYHKPAGRVLFDKDEIDRWIAMSEGVSLEQMDEYL